MACAAHAAGQASAVFLAPDARPPAHGGAAERRWRTRLVRSFVLAPRQNFTADPSPSSPQAVRRGRLELSNDLDKTLEEIAATRRSGIAGGGGGLEKKRVAAEGGHQQQRGKRPRTGTAAAAVLVAGWPTGLLQMPAPWIQLALRRRRRAGNLAGHRQRLPTVPPCCASTPTKTGTCRPTPSKGSSLRKCNRQSTWWFTCASQTRRSTPAAAMRRSCTSCSKLLSPPAMRRWRASKCSA